MEGVVAHNKGCGHTIRGRGHILCHVLRDTMAKKVAESMKAAWTAAKRDISESAHTDLLKQDVIDVIEIAKNKAMLAKSRQTNSPDFRSSTTNINKVEVGVNCDAGSDLLSHFKDSWGEIHASIEGSSRKAAATDAELKSLNLSVTRSHVIINKCREEFKCLREVLEALDETHGKVKAIGDLMNQVEEDLHNYCLVKEELESERRKHSLLKQHTREIEEDDSKVEQLRRILTNEQKLSLSLQNDIENKELKDRQNAFQEIFDKQMADYRQKGEVDRPINEIREKEVERSLEEVVIEDEDGTTSLHEFLCDVVLDEDAPPGEEEEEEDGGGGSIEEDGRSEQVILLTKMVVSKNEDETPS